MRVHIACDHAAFELKEHLVAELTADGHEVTDHGAKSFDPQDHYPTTCIPAAEAVVADPGSLGVVLGGSGNGEQMAANCVKGVRAALAWSEETAKLAREHNNANVVAVGARQHSLEDATRFVRAFLATPFSGDERHLTRIKMMDEYRAAH